MYKKMYLTLFNAITDALKYLEWGNCAEAKMRLMMVQRETEEMFLEGDRSETQSPPD